ncbi:MAG TPA: AMIN domain-containing protein [Firmicutes bacterium]|nr:AMIN domain-containing protein [Bacillota bacterium]
MFKLAGNKWVYVYVLVSLMVAFFSPSLLPAENTRPLFFEGRAVNGEARIYQGCFYLPLSFFSEYLHTAAVWDKETGKIQLQAGAHLLTMQEDAAEISWGGEKRRLAATPRQAEGGLWLPVEVAKFLGVREEKTTGERLSLSWEKNYLLSIRNTDYQGRPAFLFQTARPFTYEAFLLEDPARLVIDFQGVDSYPLMTGVELATSPPVTGIRSSRFSEDKLRVVFDLSRLAGYRIVEAAEDPAKLQVVFNSLLTDAGYLPAGEEGGPLVYVETSHPVSSRSSFLPDPDRLVVDISDATLAGEAMTIPGDGDWVEQVRISQFDPHTIRLVLYINGAHDHVAAAVRDRPNRLEIRPTQEITGIDWNDREKRLQIKSTGPLQEEIRKIPGGLVVELRDAVLTDTVQNGGNREGIKVATEDPSGVRVEVAIPEGRAYDYRVEFAKDKREMVLTITQLPLSGKVIILDPGHGGIDAGAIGTRGTREKEINLDVALRLKKRLEEAGARVVMTREDDSYLGLYERPAVVNRFDGVLAISLHANFHPNPKVRGVEVFYHPGRESSRKLAEYIFTSITKATGLTGRSIKTDKEMVFPRETQMPSVLVEMGFLSNRQEEELFRKSEFREKLAAGLFLGILRYLGGE